MRLLPHLLTFCLLAQAGAQVVAQEKKAVPTLSLKLESAKKSIPSGTAPLLRLTVENVGRADERILKPRRDLQDTYYDLVITDKQGKVLSLPRAISDPGPVGEADYLALKPGMKTTFEFSSCAVAVERLPPGKYQAQIRFWQEPYKSHTTAVMSPATTFTVEK